MNDVLTWALEQARNQTLTLAADIAPEPTSHSLWILGHLTLGDTYLLSLLGAEPLSSDFDGLLRKYGPRAASSNARQDDYDSKAMLVDRLAWLGARRLDAVRHMRVADLERVMPDPYLARTQPTIAHHLHALVCHEGYHRGAALRVAPDSRVSRRRMGFRASAGQSSRARTLEVPDAQGDADRGRPGQHPRPSSCWAVDQVPTSLRCRIPPMDSPTPTRRPAVLPGMDEPWRSSSRPRPLPIRRTHGPCCASSSTLGRAI